MGVAMADHRRAQNVKQTNEATHQRRSVEPISQEWAGLQPFDLTTLQRSVANPGLARPADILNLQRACGNRAVVPLLQAKLTVGPVGDRYEREADQVAEQVMSMPNPQAGSRQQSTVSGQPSLQRQAPEDEEEVQTKLLAASITPLVQRQAEEEEEVQAKPLAQRQDMPEEEELQAKPLVQRQADGGFEGSPDLEHRLAAHKGSGSPLSSQVRAFMEPRFGADFSSVVRWRAGPFHPPVKIEDITISTLSHGAVHVWLL